MRRAEGDPAFLAGPCNHIYHCTYPVQEFHDGQAHFEGDIRGHDELYHVQGRRHLLAHDDGHEVSGAGHWHIVPIVGAQASMKAHFLDRDLPGRRQAGQTVGRRGAARRERKSAGRA